MGILSVILVGSLYGFGALLDHRGISAASGLSRIGSFILYLSLLFLFLMFRNRQWKSKQTRFLALIRILLLAIVGIFGLHYGIQSILLLLVAAYVEEFLKITAAQTQSDTTHFNSDILTFALLIALGFSIVENLLYIGLNFSSGEAGGFGLFVGRWIFASGVHILATGVIALLLFKLYQSTQMFAHKSGITWTGKILARVILGMLAGVGLHFGYNFCIAQGWTRVYGIVVIGGFFLLSYLLFLSDRLYQD